MAANTNMKKLVKITVISTLVITIGVFIYNNVYAKKLILKNKHLSDNIGILKQSTKEVFRFKMDSLTEARNIEYMQLFNSSEGNEFLTFINTSTNILYYYELKNKQIAKTLDLKTFGFDLDNPIQGYNILNKDSIVFYTYSDSKLTLLDLRKGKLLTKTINQRSTEQIQNVHPFVSTRTPILYSKSEKKLYFTGYFSQEGGPASRDGRRNVVAAFSLLDGTITHAVHYPKYYWGINWGGASGLRQAFYDLQDDEIVMSFMAAHDVILYDTSLVKSKKRYMGNSKIKQIESMSYSNNIHDFLGSYTLYNYYLSTGSYTSIKYDPFRKLWYRIAEYPELFKKGRLMHKKKSITISDKDFNVIGESDISETKFDLSQMIVSKDGLMIKSLETSQNELVMECITFQK